MWKKKYLKLFLNILFVRNKISLSSMTLCIELLLKLYMTMKRLNKNDLLVSLQML